MNGGVREPILCQSKCCLWENKQCKCRNSRVGIGLKCKSRIRDAESQSSIPKKITAGICSDGVLEDSLRRGDSRVELDMLPSTFSEAVLQFPVGQESVVGSRKIGYFQQ